MLRIDTLFPGVHLLQGEVGDRPLQLPLLVGPTRALLLDSGCASDPEKLILPGLAQLGVPLEKLGFLLNTHCDLDHQGGNAALKAAAPHLVLGCGDADRAAIEAPQVIFAERYDAYRRDHGHASDDKTRAGIFSALGAAQPVDLTFLGGESLRLGPDWVVEILHLPGHSRGHLGVWDQRHRILFGGDAVQGRVYLDTRGVPALGPTYLHVQPYLSTLARIESLPLDAYVGCHWPVARDRASVHAFCAESRAFVQEAEAALVGAIRAAPPSGITLRELCFSVGPKLGGWPLAANYEMCYAFAGHLSDLAARGLIREQRTATPFRYTAAT